jgi:hypothetical protein
MSDQVTPSHEPTCDKCGAPLTSGINKPEPPPSRVLRENGGVAWWSFWRSPCVDKERGA